MEYYKYRLQLVRENEFAFDNYTLTTSEKVAEFLRETLQFHLLDREECVLIALNAKGDVIGINTLSIGDLSTSIVHPRELVKFAVLSNASALILAHNHPSGDPTPSGEDIRTTKRLIEVGELMGIKLVDHIIIADYKSKSLMNYINKRKIER